MQSKTKKGATSLITTMFFTLLAGILVLSFISIMLTNINESTNYNLSQSAYDAALAGIEDAKVALLLYNDCVSRGDADSTRCERVVNALGKEVDAHGNPINQDENCDIVRDILGRAEGTNETPVRTDNSSIRNGDKGVDASFDMAYTCVKLTSKVPDYLGKITKDSDMKVIPLRTKKAVSDDETTTVNRVRIEWFSNNDYSNVVDNNLQSLYAGTAGIYSSIQYTNNKFASANNTGTPNNGTNRFGAESYIPPAITVGLFQAANNFRLSDFDENHGTATNRGRITLRAVKGAEDPVTHDGTGALRHIVNTATEGFAASAMAGSTNYSSKISSSYRAENSPLDVQCYTGDAIRQHTYACAAEIDLPKAYTIKQDWWGREYEAEADASDVLRFLTLSTPYSKPDISFSVIMLSCKADNTCETVDFVGVQSKVDSTGRANDLFRRIEARVELTDVGYPFPKYALGVYCDSVNKSECGEDGNLIKNYNATSNCYSIANGKKGFCDESNTGSDRAENYGRTKDEDGNDLGGFYNKSE